MDGVADSAPCGAQCVNCFARRQRRRSNPEAALLAAEPRDQVRNQCRHKLLAIGVRVTDMHAERDAVDSRQAKTRDVGKLHHRSRKRSVVLVMRTQVQPVALQTRSSPVPGAP